MLAVWEDKEQRSKLNKINSKALGALKQNVRKFNKAFETDIEEYRKVSFGYDFSVHNWERLTIVICERRSCVLYLVINTSLLNMFHFRTLITTKRS